MPEKLGEYRRVREIGRGGMGIVYEAVQESLGRRVALKVLPTHAVMHPTYLARFRREAKAAARLHHTNIVPVFGVGDQDGIHFYAMQHIQGQGLDQVLKEVRRLREAHAASTLARGTADSGEPRATQGTAVETDSSLTALAPSSSWSKSDAPYCAAVARLGVQAADALAYAHEHGVLHRDIKPSNLLLDTHGTLWVSDFGLAKTDDLDALTDTGDLVGTLRYMAPERLTHGSDARGDVYSLGATLYEMLTLRPAFEERDRGRLIRQVAQEEPPRPRKLAPHVPLDLETIVLKAMAKHPSHRYVSAAEMAEDLRRFLADRPIKAHRTRPWEHVRRWAARNPALAGTGSVAVLALVTGLLLTGWQWRRAETHFTAMTQAYQQAKRSGEEAQAATEKRQMQQVVLTREVARGLEESVRWQAQENWPEARAAVVRAAGFLSSGQGSEGLQQRVTERRKDLEMVHKLQEIRLGMSNVRNDGFAFADTDAGYALAFREYGIDVLSLSFEESAARLSSRSVAQELAVALDDWAVVGNANQRWKELLALAAAIDPDAWRNRFREVRRQGDYTGLKALADSEEVGQLPASTLQNLGSILLDSGAVEEALALLRQAQHRFPHDFWVNYTLAEALRAASPPHWSEAVRYYTVARALRRQSPGVNVNLGAVLAESGSLEEAIAMFREAVRLQPDYGAAHYNLGTALSASGSADEAVVELQESVRLRPRYPEGFCNLGSALKAQGKPDAAISAFRTALDLKSDHLTALTQLGAVLFDNSRFEEAVVVFRRAIQVSPDDAGLHLRLGDALQELARLAEAISAFRDAIRLLPDSALAYSRLGSALVANKSLDEGIAALREAIRLAPERSVGHYNLGNALKTKPSFDEAIAAYREAVRLKPDDFQSWNNLGQALRGKGSVDEAIAAFREALRVKPDHVAALINLGDVLRTKGQAEEAIAVLRQAVGLDPNQASARTNLGAALRLMGDLEGAIAEYREAIRLQPDLVAAHSNLGSALRLRGNLEEALLALREAIRLQPDHAEAHCNLGLTLRAQGRFVEALAALERGHELGSRRRGWTFPSARWVQETRHSVELDQKLPGVLKGAYKPSAAECLQFAQICDAKRLTAAAARLYQAAFEQQPEAAAHTKTHYRYQAARTAAQAGCGQGQDAGELSEQDRSRWRGQAFEWLRADLAHWTDAASDTDGMPSRSTLLQWQRDPALAALREPDSIAKLPPVEQDPWRRFWQDVATVLAKAQPSANRPPQLR